MKFLIALLFILSNFTYAQTQAPRRSNALLRFIIKNQVIRNYALYSVIGKRCVRYMPLPERLPCQKAVKRQLELLDYDMLLSSPNPKKPSFYETTDDPNSYIFVAFKKDLIRLLSLPKTKTYLRSLQNHLSKFLTGEDPNFNVWELTLAHYGTKEAAALTLAALFQDTSLVRLHLAYLEQTRVRGTMSFDDNKELLGRVIETVNFILDQSEDNYRTLFYPREVRGQLNRNIYHFYVPLYLSIMLKRDGVSPRLAYAAPLMLNLTYEFITASADFRYVLNDPVHLSQHGFNWKLKDIFGGYWGAAFGTNKANVRTFPELQTAFTRSTYEGVSLLLAQ